MPDRANRRVAALTALLIATAACSDATGSVGVSPDSRVDAGSGRPSADDADSTSDGSSAPVLRFSAPRLGGGTVEGEDYSGSDVAFWFWAPW